MSRFSINDIIEGRYKVLKVLGEGAQSCVYLAEDLKLPKAVWALKQLKLYEQPQEDRTLALKMFRREANILRILNSPAFPKLIDFIEMPGKDPILIMERIKGIQMHNLLCQMPKPLNLCEALAISSQTAGMLKLLHSLTPPVIYRDLKPSNLILSSCGLVRMIDFGIARFKKDPSAKDTQELGTPGYSAPEQYRGATSPQSDIYSLGAIMFQLLTLKDPQDCSFIFPKLRTLNSEVPSALEELVSQCLDLDPKKRPQSAEEVQKRLEKIILSLPDTNSRNTQILNLGLESLSRHIKYIKESF